MKAKDTLYSEVINAIPYGRENAISRWDLIHKLHIGDRKMRKYIQEANEAGEMIINLQDGRGYFRFTDDDAPELARRYKANQARIISISRQQKFIRERLKEVPGQTVLETHGIGGGDHGVHDDMER